SVKNGSKSEQKTSSKSSKKSGGSASTKGKGIRGRKTTKKQTNVRRSTSATPSSTSTPALRAPASMLGAGIGVGAATKKIEISPFQVRPFSSALKMNSGTIGQQLDTVQLFDRTEPEDDEEIDADATSTTEEVEATPRGTPRSVRGGAREVIPFEQRPAVHRRRELRMLSSRERLTAHTLSSATLSIRKKSPASGAQSHVEDNYDPAQGEDGSYALSGSERAVDAVSSARSKSSSPNSARSPMRRGDSPQLVRLPLASPTSTPGPSPRAKKGVLSSTAAR
ncbi:unnamed protein product, partial [Amoebophrya sp. A25]